MTIERTVMIRLQCDGTEPDCEGYFEQAFTDVVGDIETAKGRLRQRAFRLGWDSVEFATSIVADYCAVCALVELPEEDEDDG